MYMLNSIYRGDDFRIAYAHLGELRSVIPSHVNVLALTATATLATLRAVERNLNLRLVKIRCGL